MQELSGGPPVGNGEAPSVLKLAPEAENGNADAYGGGDRDLKPWQRGPTGAAAPGNNVVAKIVDVVMIIPKRWWLWLGSSLGCGWSW
jgi:hypothetical protein